MSFHITRHDLDRARRAVETVHHHVRRDGSLTEKVSAFAGQFSRSLTLNGVAFATGLAQGRFGPMLLPGNVPAVAVVGLAGHVAGFFGLGGEKHNQVLHNIADGMLAPTAHLFGMGFGGKLRTSAGLPAIWGDGRVAGALGAGSGPPSDAELASLSRAVR